MMYELNGNDLDNWITGHYGEDQVEVICAECEECADSSLADDPGWVCPHDFDNSVCDTYENEGSDPS